MPFAATGAVEVSGSRLKMRKPRPQRHDLKNLRAKLMTQRQYQAHIYVTLRRSVLDPAGTAVESGLKNMGYDNVTGVRIGKYVELSICASDEQQARNQLDRICDELLANPVIENYRFELTEVATVQKAEVNS
jgi:phosphoribosylformylglycinamidine synthase PurS subunit